MPVYWTVYLDGAGEELDRLARGPDMRTIAAMEAALLAGYTITEARVHVITGELKASGHPSSHFGGDSWEGTIAYATHPGIFELARADRPTRYHPDGGHYFFDPGGPLFERGVRQAIWDWVTDDKGGPAPSGGLGPYSGGD
jgi:hypothetical protein